MYKYDKKLISERFIKIREERGLTQEQVAEKLDCSPKTISNMERGQHAITLERIISSANLFKVPVDYFIEDESTENYEVKKKLTGIIDKLYDIIKEI